MSTTSYTPNMGLTQPGTVDPVDVNVINANMGKLDGHTHGGPPDGLPVKAVQSGPNGPTSAAGAGQLYVSTGTPALYFADGSSWNQLQNAPTGSTKIAAVILASPASMVTFSSIPQTFQHLQIHWQAGGNGVGGWLCLYPNNDWTAANFCTLVWWGNSGSVSHQEWYQNREGFYFAELGASGVVAGVISIPNYRGGFGKQMISSYQSVDPSMASGNIYSGQHGGIWNVASAITSLQLGISGTMAAGSVFTLYGLA